MELTTTNNAGSNSIQEEIETKNQRRTCNSKQTLILIALVLSIIFIGSITAIIIIFNLKWSTIAAIIYFSSYFLLLIVLALYINFSEQHKNKKSFLKSLWSKRGIYGQVFVHLYDTATDLGVMIEWYLLMEQEKSGERNIESLDMEGLFWTTISFLILYRVSSCCCAICSTGSDEHGYLMAAFDGCCLGLLDLYVIKVVYNAIKEEKKEPPPRQKMFQLGESVFESLPQVVLQSVFIIRGYNDKELRDDNTLVLVGTSLFASLFSIANKFTWVDKDAVDDNAKEPEFKKRCPCINMKYVLRVVWRFSYVLTRFCIISLIWSVLGGAFVGIFLGLSWILWWCTFVVVLRDDSNSDWDDMLFNIFMMGGYAIVSLVASPAVKSIVIAIVHMLEMVASIIVITLFAFNSYYDCGICADPTQRQADNNPFILMFLITAWVSMVVDFVTYGLMLCLEIFEDGDEAVLALLQMALRGIDNDPKGGL